MIGPNGVFRLFLAIVLTVAAVALFEIGGYAIFLAWPVAALAAIFFVLTFRAV